MTVPENQSKTALITGASAGIGYSLAKLFARDQFDLVLVSRDRKRLEEVAAELESSYKCRTAVVPKDLTISRAPDELYEELQNNSVDIDVLVNNAGVGAHGAFHKSDTQQILNLVRLNIDALVHMTRLFLPRMVERGNGRVLNVASVAAYQPGPFMATYYASKAFVLSFSEAIAVELKGTGVTMTTLCPGPTRTQFNENAGIAHSKLGKSARVALSPDAVANIGYDAMLKGKRTVIAGLKNRVAAFASSRVLPKSLVINAIATVNRNR